MIQSSRVMEGQPGSIIAASAETDAFASQADRPVNAGHLTNEVLAVAEKALARLPAGGSCVVCGSLTPQHDEAGFAMALAKGLQLISAKRALFVELGEPGAEAAISRTPGVMEILRGDATLAQAALPAPHSELKIIGPGRRGENAAELLVSMAFREFLQQARKEYQWVMVHNHHLLEGEESLSIISRADALVATLKRGEGYGRDVAAARQLCEQFKTVFLGVVLT
jgi:hypothetical protein